MFDNSEGVHSHPYRDYKHEAQQCASSRGSEV
jgi:hypothetical protein